MIKKNIAKRQRTTPTGTDLGKETPTSPDWTRILCHEDLKEDFFMILPTKAVLSLRFCLKEWIDLPLHYMVGRCLKPPTSTILPDIAQLKDNFSLLQCFHKIYSKNLTLDKQLALLNNNPAFITTKKKYMDYTQAYTILKQNTDSLSPEQEEKLATLYGSLKTPYQTQKRLTMKAINSIQDEPIELDLLNTHIQKYINTNLQTEKETLIERLREEPGSNEEAKANHTADVTDMITNHPLLVFATDEDGDTTLHLAAWKGHTEVAKYLLANWAEVNAITNNGYTPLHWAAKYGHTDIVRILLEAGAKVNSTVTDGPFKGTAPLHWAAQSGHTEIVQVLLEAGVDVDATVTDGVFKAYTPLHWAAFWGELETVETLLQAGADVNATTNEGKTPLHFAAWKGHKDILETLLKHGAKIEAQLPSGHTPLHLAVLHGNTEAVRILLANRANPIVTTGEGLTPLHLAAKYGGAEITQALITVGVDVNATTNGVGSPLYLAANYGHTEAVRILLANRALVTYIIPDGFMEGSTPLHAAAQGGHEKVAELLLNARADVNAIDKNGWTGLHMAVLNGHTETVKILLANRANVATTTTNKNTPLLLSTLAERAHIKALLHEAGART